VIRRSYVHEFCHKTAIKVAHITANVCTTVDTQVKQELEMAVHYNDAEIR